MCDSLRHAILPTRRRESGHFEGICLIMASFPVSCGKNRMSQGVENRGPPTSVPLALREIDLIERTFRFYAQEKPMEKVMPFQSVVKGKGGQNHKSKNFGIVA